MHSHEQALQRFLYDGNFDKSAREINGRNASGARQTSFFFFLKKKKRQSKSKRATFYLNFDYPVLCVTFEEPSSNLRGRGQDFISTVKKSFYFSGLIRVY